MSSNWKNQDQKNKFYHSKKWIEIRNEVRSREMGICQECDMLVAINGSVGNNRFINGIVDHVIEINEESTEFLKYDKENLQLLCIECHNNKTLSKVDSLLEEKNAVKKINFRRIHELN